MTEAEWLACGDPAKMQCHLFDGDVSFRKSLLWSCGCCRSAGSVLNNDTRDLIELAEVVADAPHHVWLDLDDGRRADMMNAVGSGQFGTPKVLQAELCRDIFGNPFRPITVDPSWLTSPVARMAQAMYDERAFERMPILADALEDVGCTDEAMLTHCRQPGVHVRGCWVVDLLLAKK
jgi:hypothetical protein